MLRIPTPFGVYSPGYVMPTDKHGATTRKQRRCGECGARPYHSCQRARTGTDGVTTWTPMRAFHKGR